MYFSLYLSNVSLIWASNVKIRISYHSNSYVAARYKHNLIFAIWQQDIRAPEHPLKIRSAFFFLQIKVFTHAKIFIPIHLRQYDKRLNKQIPV